MTNRRSLLSAVCAYALLGSVLSGCLPSYTPFSTNPPAKDLTRKNLEALARRQIPGDTFKVILASDPQQDPFAFDDLMERINRRPDLNEVAFVAVLGDLTQWGYEHEYEWLYEGIKKLDAPFFGVIGNHDSISNGPELYRKMFGPYDFVIDYKTTRFVVYNDNRYEFPSAPDKPWIYKQLDEAAGRDHLITMSHVPILEDASDEEKDGFVTELLNRGVDHMWAAHLHIWEYWVDRGISFFNVTKVRASTLHYAVITISPNEIVYEQCTPECKRVN